ncbi:MAG: tRNA preQ1(34) S-adenosylmethionine ribosyltransferase-isomerase QueA [Spirochaetales bacterium]|nr:tRNA preQ1(34) S-adenosylmethionine ribosyltransferase-isomerase QueA [Spirochaetales bacterium]
MKTSSFSFELPPELIAQEPAVERGSSRLLVLDRSSGRVSHRLVRELPELLEPGTLVLLNDSRVRKARLFAEAEGTGTRVEFLLLREIQPARWAVLVSRARKQVPGKRYRFPAGVEGRIVGSEGEFRLVEFSRPIDDAYLEEHGHVPLPPYIRRSDTPADAARYQTVYARRAGSAAAPTAGLHLTDALLEALQARGVEIAELTLHVGAGTFLPIRTERIEEHRMHEEWYFVPEASAEAINRACAQGRPVLAVGTTAVRAVESAWREGEVRAGEGRTGLFIAPGYRFRVVSRLLTNFHTPRSSLLVLVSALAGRERVLEAYAEAVRERYRFFSYGDAMLIV